MSGISVLLGGKAGDGIDKAGSVIAKIFNKHGLYVFVHRDYPSLIRGGHTFSIIRASNTPIKAHEDMVDIVIALDQKTADTHRTRLKKDGILVHDNDTVKSDGLAVNMTTTIKNDGLLPIFQNTYMVGVLCGILDIQKDILKTIIEQNMAKETDLNLKVALKGYSEVKVMLPLKNGDAKPIPLMTGNEALAMGFAAGGLEEYYAYPMTPSSTILHFLAENGDELGVKVVHPESEIAVINMALGSAYTGKKAAVGTSGGGFCLMTEGVSFAGMAEIPITIILGQRPGPSTGLPTYTAQTELNFAISSGHGEFVRLITAPGDAKECFELAGLTLGLSWKYQIPAFILTDKTIAESTYNFDLSKTQSSFPSTVLWDGNGEYNRYQMTNNGISPLAFPGNKIATVKTSSYEHLESGITTESAEITKMMQDKRMKKLDGLMKEIDSLDCVKTYGNTGSDKVILFWGSNKGACVEAAEKLNIKAVQVKILWPTPTIKIKEALKGAKKKICIENNYTGQLRSLLEAEGIKIDSSILKYDGRPFAVDELAELLRKEL